MTVSLLSGFEQRLERVVDGFFARVFRSGVHPVEIGKRLLRVMEDGKTVALRRTYVPNVYRILLSSTDYDRLEALEHQLVEELEVFISEAARQREWVLADAPRVSFAADQRLGRGEFKIEAEAVSLESRRPRRSGDARTETTRTKKGPGSLVLLSDDGPIRTLSVDDRIRIGRQSDNDLVVPDPGVSRHHAEVVAESGDFLVRDLGSTNGTHVNGEQIDEHRLLDGDRITVGHSSIEFRRG